MTMQIYTHSDGSEYLRGNGLSGLHVDRTCTAPEWCNAHGYTPSHLVCDQYGAVYTVFQAPKYGMACAIPGVHISPFPVIFPEIQSTFEAAAISSGTEDNTPAICGYYGRACRCMGDPSGACRALCSHCPLAEYAANLGSF